MSDERFDVLDESGQKLGKVLHRDEVHRRGLWHKSAHVWIINSKQELLLQKRAPQKETSPNMWDISVAGHVPAGETPISAAIREAQEELGLHLEDKDFRHLFTVTQEKKVRNDYINREFNDVYLVSGDFNPSTFLLQEEEVSEVKYIDYRKLESLLAAKYPDYLDHPDEFRELFKYLHKKYRN